MNDQTALLSLFDDSQPTAPYRKDSATSLRAAVKVTPRIKAIHMLILAEMRRHGPMNADRCASLLFPNDALAFMRVRPRFCELGGGTDRAPGLKLIERTGEVAPSAAGNPMDVFCLTESGQKTLKDSADSFHAANDVGGVDPVAIPKAS